MESQEEVGVSRTSSFFIFFLEMFYDIVLLRCSCHGFKKPSCYGGIKAFAILLITILCELTSCDLLRSFIAVWINHNVFFITKMVNNIIDIDTFLILFCRNFFCCNGQFFKTLVVVDEFTWMSMYYLIS